MVRRKKVVDITFRVGFSRKDRVGYSLLARHSPAGGWPMQARVGHSLAKVVGIILVAVGFSRKLRGPVRRLRRPQDDAPVR
ncbi:MAG: hypothetical protein ACREVA_12990 [Burkholderiales bacterium]